VNEPSAEQALSGIVESFDADVGLGVVRSSTGAFYHFHCIEIADGTRQIDVGVQVAFDALPKFGRYEASNLR